MSMPRPAFNAFGITTRLAFIILSQGDDRLLLSFLVVFLTCLFHCFVLFCFGVFFLLVSGVGVGELRGVGRFWKVFFDVLVV